MKIRMGFVSNSSSSNFIVAFPKEPKSVEEVKKILFGSKDTFCNHPAEKVAQTVFDVIKNQNPNDLDSAFSYVSRGWFDGCPSLEDFAGPDGKTDFDSHEAVSLVKAELLLEKFLDRVGNSVFIYVFSFGDEDGEYFSDLEHEGTFKRLPHLQVSCH